MTTQSSAQYVAHYSEQIYLAGISDRLFYDEATNIMKDLARKKVSGKYDAKLALKAWVRWVESVVRNYRRDFGKNSLPFPLSMEIKTVAAKKAQDYYDEAFKAHVVLAKKEAAAKVARKKVRKSRVGLKAPTQRRRY